MSTASTKPASDGTSPGPMARPTRIRWGGIIFFKVSERSQVEDVVFEAPQYRFTELSEVFETMFHLPAGSDGNVEGRDEEHPILLEGYRAAHLKALLEVIYPTVDDMISGSFKLEKDEWIGVLNLATRWSMNKIRTLAISELSKVSLNPVEKVTLGREYKVAKWLRDGLTELVSEHPIRPLPELKSQLGAEMTCTLLWIQNQTLQKPHGEVPALTGLTLGMLGCYYCQAAMFMSSRHCSSCSHPIAFDDWSALYLADGYGNASFRRTQSPPPTGPARSDFSTISLRPIAHPKRIRWGGIVFFKVEGIIFEAPRYRFSEHSEVFETMFHLPTGSDGAIEGQDEDHPIVLEGYKAAHFDALLNVLYPTPQDLISGALKLDKEKWIGVLSLSTRWSMKQIRKHAIDELSKVSINPVEKIALGRENKVAKWFQDGLAELISEPPTRPLAELKSQLGAETVCTLLWIQNQTLPTSLGEGSVLSGPTLSMLRCYYGCEAAIFTSDTNCHSCGRAIAVDDPKALYLATGAGTTVESSRISQKILEEFGDEIAVYESWDGSD
ncbi:hypothetical protein EST38_g12755 [Candolleomyces aberdarensis]|uniref:BTB domain-containing protein n=1 Tax=Candolleomyces aberdarensis TaxID=2316362 RepID=A0A4Q2D1M7_9AGAR|nr:hypothetical protein EST38_g12755 [Candolleomyces aberdarensis]